MDTEKSNIDWSDVEIQAAVDAYLKMLALEQSGQKFNKALENRILREDVLADRTQGSVEFRMQNISAVLDELGLPRISGYKPAKNIGTHIKDRIRAILAEKKILNPDGLTHLGQGRCAWIFQYAPGGQFERRWLSSPERGQTVPWEISQFQDLMRPGDLVFYWQTTEQGGLRGWGEIDTGELIAIGENKKTRDYRIGVREGCWLESPISPTTVFSAGVLSKNNSLFSSHQANSPLTPEEAAGLATLFSNAEQPSLDRLITHEQRKLQVHEGSLTERLSDASSISVKRVRDEDALEVLFHNDDPWAVGLEDKIGVLDEAKAMAALAIRTEEPPLAIGILGDWGTGKSFFMRLIHQQIQERSTDTVLIRFNAWHFVDSNLWASLVDHIFTELDQWVRKREIGEQSQRSSEQLFEKLSTAQELALEAAERLVRCRQAQKIATERLAEAERSTNLFWESVAHTLKSKISWEKVQTAAQSLGLGQLCDDTVRLKETIDSLDQQRTRIQIIKEGLLHRIGSWPVILAGVAIILIAPPAFSKTYVLLNEFFQVQINSITKDLLALTGPIAGITAGIALLIKHLRKAVDQIADFRETLNAAIEQQATSHSQTLSKLEADVVEARSLVATTTERVAEATHEFDAGTGRGRMLRFIRERANDGHYASHLGLVAAIRKDFEELSRGLRADPEVVQHPLLDGKFQKRIQDLLDDPKNHLKPADKEKLALMQKATSAPELQHFKRIVLFIDDLDRCPPSKVVEVLQAVHLLLGFPLFIVFVAADVRWVNRALTKHYPDLLDNPLSDNTRKEQGATAHDYLEKIFQIPYWVRPMNAGASIALLESRIRRVDKSLTPPSLPPSLTDGTILAKNQDIEDSETSIKEELGLESTSQESDDFNHRANRLSFSDVERAFLSQLAPFAGSSPRRVLRFINTYRIIKISLSDDENAALEQRYFRELLLQLAINTGAPEVFGQWLDFLQQNANTSDMRKLLDNMRQQSWYSLPSVNRALQGAVQVYLNTNTSGSVQDAFEASKLVKRYSFVG
jgi:hypothetical protein